MPWLQAHLTTDKTRAPLIELLFENLGALSVTLDDAEDEPLLEPPPGASPLWQRTRVTGLFQGDTDADALRGAIHKTLNQEVGRDLQLQVLEDQVWERVWLERFHPMRFGSRLWICPDGQRPKDEDGVFLDLDPGLAFGTGTHPTTALCLQWLDRAGVEDTTLMDFGCGSGILAIAALKLGAQRAIAIDHDPQALQATRDNATRNGVLQQLQIQSSDESVTGPVDLLLANILASTLIRLHPQLAGYLKPGGRLILSGILSEQAQQVSDAFEPDFKMQPPRILEEWVLLEGRRH